jgi:PIN domain nuclease of toxin-antitoxin system
MPMINLDTHMLVFALNGEIRPAERALLAQNRWSVAAIVLWELAKLIDLGRIDMDLDDRDVSRVLNRIPIWPLDLAVARASTRLDFESDPADQLIAATSIVHNIPLLTRDRVIRRSKLVPLAIPGRRIARGARRSSSQRLATA